MGWGLPIFMGMSWHLLYSGAIPHHPSSSNRALFLTCLLAWGDPKRFCSHVAFLLILPKEGIAGERVYGLAMVWFHPYQSRVSTTDDAARKLTFLASARPNWPYTFVWFNGDAHHMPLLKEDHLDAMVEGMPSNIPCGRISQLEVHQPLHLEAWVVYPKGLNGCLVLVIITLPESLPHSVTMLNDEPTFLQVDILQFTMDGHESKTPFLGGGSASTSPTCPAMAPPTRQRVKWAWPWRSVNSYHGQLWIPLVKHWGVPPLKASVPGLRSITPSHARPLRCPHRQAFQMMLNQMIWPLKRFPYQSKLWDWVPVSSLEM